MRSPFTSSEKKTLKSLISMRVQELERLIKGYMNADDSKYPYREAGYSEKKLLDCKDKLYETRSLLEKINQL